MVDAPTERVARDDAHDPTLATLLTAAQDGEHAAFATLHERFVRVVHGIALGQCGFDDAADVTQDAFLKINRDIGAVDRAASLPGWICSVARSVAIDHCRRRARRPIEVELPDVPARSLPDDNLAPHVLRRVEELPEAYRETLILRLVEGLSGPEIATATGLTPGSVRVNLHRGMSMLRERLSKDGWP